MNNTINTYKNAPMFCAKPNAKQARQLKDVSVKTVKRQGKMKITQAEICYNENGVKISQEMKEETPPWKYGIYTFRYFDSKGNVTSSFASPYRVDRRPWYKRLFSRNK